MTEDNRTYIAIDLKSFFASVECVERGLDPLTTNLVVADVSRTEKTICLAVSPSLKAYGIGGRARLFEVVQRLREVNNERRYKSPFCRLTGKSWKDEEFKVHEDWEVDYIAAPPRMAKYIEYSTRIYQIYLKYVAPEDIHVYSIDEVFMDVTAYLDTYRMTAHELAMTMIRDVLKNTGITATAGIGTNLYLCKIAMDIMAKKAPADKDGVRIAELNEMSYREQLWDYTPITKFWRVGKGIAEKLAQYGMYTMGDVALCSVEREGLLYKLFGVNAELLIDHAWGREPCRMQDIKSYKSKTHSVSFSQILPKDYTYDEARVVMTEMILHGCQELMRRKVICQKIWIGVGYSKDVLPMVNGQTKLTSATAVNSLICPFVLDVFDRITDRSVPIRRLGISFNDVCDEGCEGYDFFTDWDAVEREKAKEKTVLQISDKYGKNAILRGTNFLAGATQRERNGMIGGHRAGYDDITREGEAVRPVRCYEGSAGGTA